MNWANRWLAYAESPRFPSEFVPRHEMRVSYGTTLFNRLHVVRPESPAVISPLFAGTKGKRNPRHRELLSVSVC